MADSIVENESSCIEKDQLSCSTSSLPPVNHVLTDTSNLDDNSKLLSKESPIKSEKSIKDVEHISPTSPSNENKIHDFEVGDIVWAKIGKYPFWPSIVCIDPETNIHIKGTPQNKRKFSLHVRFCNDQGRRSWAKIVEMYNGKDKLLTDHPNCLALIKNSKKQMMVWDSAVKEADNWLKINRDERMERFSKTNGLSRSKLSGLGPVKKTLAPKTSIATSDDNSNIPTVEEFLASRRAIDLAARAKLCEPSTSGSQETKFKASTSNSSMPQCYVHLKDIANKRPKEKPIELPKNVMEPPKKAIKRKYVDLEKKQLRETLKKKKAKRALQVKKYGFSYSSSEYESTDDEALPLVPFNPNRKVLQSIKFAVANLESEGIKKLKEKRILIKAIRLAEKTSNSKKIKEEEEED
ncbi:histone-lysine N-methyltransferase NSD3-like isoform X2 [Melanaphis sacchari]|uniref:Histone-lysine N-methyltransferase NSD3 n=2 Tax=Melanaphis sacchari TaxID=742174 RepID=A0A2H8TRQ3_9HEMI|nr:histone-lysine N-methyltransferase NSD3-like isoform X2 [Melanaphis sacchari]XP_025191299.1 histone-lysine N-methyltransferase NSD3-like isoform X2 [Melanaphis sacchari]